jgi:hypothetical protein
MPVSYRYLFCDLLTDQPLTTLELSGVSFERRIIEPGAFRATIPIPNATVAAKVRKVFPREDQWPPPAGPGRVICHVYRDGLLWGSYIIWQVTPSGDERGNVSLDLQGASLESYLYRREIWADQSYTMIDQVTIAQQLITSMQSDTPGNIGLVTVATTQPGAPPPVSRTRSYKGSEAATYGDRLAELANADQGFEYYIRTTDDGTTRAREFVTGYPKLGNPKSAANLMFSQPGSVIGWSYSNDATSAATRWRARGDSVGDQPVVSAIAQADTLLNAGWPYLDRTVDHQGSTDTVTLGTYANHQAAVYSGAVRIPQITVRLDAGSSFFPNRLGDYARITIVDDWWPLDASGAPTFAHTWRVVGIEVTPAQRGTPEQATLIFEENTSGNP